MIARGHTDKIRVDYIESEMTKRSQQRHLLASDIHGNPTSASPVNEATGETSTSGLAQREPATLGRLHEIDLGHENRIRNIARTQAATRSLGGSKGQQAVASAAGPGLDGKKAGGPERKERSMQDIERDRLVEEVLRESRRMSSSSFASREIKRLTSSILSSGYL